MIGVDLLIGKTLAILTLRLSVVQFLVLANEALPDAVQLSGTIPREGWVHIGCVANRGGGPTVIAAPRLGALLRVVGARTESGVPPGPAPPRAPI